MESKLWAVAGAVAAGALIVGGVIGGLIGYGNGGGDARPASAAPATVTAEPRPPQVTIPETPDPVCAEWAPLLDSYNAQQAAWTNTDPAVPAERWSPEQRALTTSIIPVLKAEAADMRRLAAKAEDPFLASLMTGQAVYEEFYAERLQNNYQPSDHRYWNAVIAFSGAVKGVCAGQ